MSYEVVYVNETQFKLKIQRIKEAKATRFRTMGLFKMQTHRQKKVVQHQNRCCYSHNHCRHTYILHMCFYNGKEARKLKDKAADCSSLKGHQTFLIALATGLKIFPLAVSLSAATCSINIPLSQMQDTEPWEEAIFCYYPFLARAIVKIVSQKHMPHVCLFSDSGNRSGGSIQIFYLRKSSNATVCK